MAIAVVAVIVWLHTGHASYPITSLALALMLGGRVVSTLGITKEDKDDYRVPPSLPHKEERREEQKLLVEGGAKPEPLQPLPERELDP